MIHPSFVDYYLSEFLNDCLAIECLQSSTSFSLLLCHCQLCWFVRENERKGRKNGQSTTYQSIQLIRFWPFGKVTDYLQKEKHTHFQFCFVPLSYPSTARKTSKYPWSTQKCSKTQNKDLFKCIPFTRTFLVI